VHASLLAASLEPRCAPYPHVVSSDLTTFLVHLVDDSDPTWGGAKTQMTESSAEGGERLAVVDFKRAYGHRLTTLE
jgi:hypothetical protein